MILRPPSIPLTVTLFPHHTPYLSCQILRGDRLGILQHHHAAIQHIEGQMVRVAEERANLARQNGHLLGAVEATHLEGVPRHTSRRRLTRLSRVNIRCAAAASLPPALRMGLELVGVAGFRSEWHT